MHDTLAYVSPTVSFEIDWDGKEIVVRVPAQEDPGPTSGPSSTNLGAFPLGTKANGSMGLREAKDIIDAIYDYDKDLIDVNPRSGDPYKVHAIKELRQWYSDQMVSDQGITILFDNNDEKVRAMHILELAHINFRVKD